MPKEPYVVLNQWDDGRMVASIILANSQREAAETKQKFLDEKSSQRDNKVVAVSQRPVWVGSNHGVYLKEVVLEEVPPPPPPKELKIEGYFGRHNAGAASRPSPFSDNPYEY